MLYDFDEILDRKGTDSVKEDGAKFLWHRDDLLPLWVADMDFRTASFIMDAIRSRCEHEVLGYSLHPEGWSDSVAAWLFRRHAWKVDSSWVGFVPGVVLGMAMGLRCFTSPGDKVMVQSPVYPPFFDLVKQSGRELVVNPLVLNNGLFNMDFDALRRDLKGCKVLMLCNPQNPGGRIWSREELRQLSDICEEYGVLVFSDEIHADMFLPGFRHNVFATVSDYAASHTITFLSASKAFNMPGLGSAYFVASDEKLRTQFTAFIESLHLQYGNVFAFIALMAAYTDAGEDWLNQMLNYVQRNVDYLDNRIQKSMSAIKVMRPQSSFLVFLDCRELGLSQENLVKLFVDKAHLALNDGATFGPGGEGFMRMNVASPSCFMVEALDRLQEALK
ncbi:MAG: pyridoxal phosphate-dependent aminotransferase [Paludibacteraceae bacterium]|nr:pyridoxal phosphate-dependent aminotransferase [Paludibacteraceae bacterium]